MKKRIYRSLCAVSALVLLLTAALSMWSFYQLMVDQARRELQTEYEIIQKGLESSQLADVEYLSALDKQFFRTRMTLIDKEGNVLYDSVGAATMENHAVRPEIIAAFATGSGEDIRVSKTSGEGTFYYARLLGDHVLRIAKPTRFVVGVFQGIFPVMLFILVMIAVLGMVVSNRLTRRILLPIERLSSDLEHPGQPDYEELEPFFQRIRDQNEELAQQMQKLTAERDRIKTITGNMQEGLILLDLDLHLLSVNRSALKLLHSRQDIDARSLLEISRDGELHGCAEKAAAGEASDTLIWRGEQACRVFASPVYSEQDEVCGAIILLLDVTEQQRAERIRRDFSANVSHELKTPLTSISGFAEMLAGGMVREEADVRRFAERIGQEASRLVTLTDDIIRLSRIESEGQLDTEPVDLYALCQQSAERLRFYAGQKEVSVEVAGEAATVAANARMLEELIGNLLENAIKYNLPGGKVRAQTAIEGGWAVIRVSDTGIGIPPEHQARVFERFYRVDKSRSKQTGGTGLGLSIVKHVAERHGGIVTVSSQETGGSLFTVKIPLTRKI